MVHSLGDRKTMWDGCTLEKTELLKLESEIRKWGLGEEIATHPRLQQH